MTRRAPSRAAAARSALSVALYSWSLAISSSPGWNRSEASTVDTPVVALGTNAIPSGSARRNWPTRSRASSRWVSSSRARNRTGWASIRSRHTRWASRTGSGQAPNDPWLRNEMSGSRSQGERSKLRGAATSRRYPTERRPRGPDASGELDRLARARVLALRAVRRHHAHAAAAGDRPRAARTPDDDCLLPDREPGDLRNGTAPAVEAARPVVR